MRVLLEGILWRFSGENRVSQIFEYVNREIEGKCIKMTLRFSCCEEIEGEFFDLLSPDGKLVLFKSENGKGFLAGLSKAYFTSPSQFFEYLSIANQNRMNNRMELNIDIGNTNTFIVVTCMEFQEDGSQKSSKLTFVELDSSQRQAINRNVNLPNRRSESVALSMVVAALHRRVTNPQTFIPYRDSKLTHLLKESLGGRDKALFILNLRQLKHWEESLNALRFGSRVTEVKNNPQKWIRVNSLPFHE